MPDRQRVGELNFKAALGMWANDVILALDHAATPAGPSEDDRRILTEAAEMLETAKRRTEEPLRTPSTAKALAATDSALSALASLTLDQRSGGDSAFLADMASLLRKAAVGELESTEHERLDSVMTLFAMVADRLLADSNPLLAPSREKSAWTATHTILSS